MDPHADASELCGEVTSLLDTLASDTPTQKGLTNQFEQFYDRLRATANYLLQSERKSHTLTPTALVHEAFVRLLTSGDRPEFSNDSYFFGAIRKAMTRVLIDHARKRQRHVAEADKSVAEATNQLDRILDDLEHQQLRPEDMEMALEALERDYPQEAAAIHYAYFLGWKQKEIADHLNVSLSKVEKDLRFARTWLARKLNDE
jgi:RNA polymerase sigma factor (TIGR02999 family)